jgi:uncharacterized protein YhfF
VPAKAASEEKVMEAKLRQVLEAAYPGEGTRYFLPMSIGNAPETADEGAVLILNGTKTLTSSPFWDYPDGKIPFVGALSVLLDGAHRPRGIVETTRVEIMPFQAITDEMAQAYGGVLYFTPMGDAMRGDASREILRLGLRCGPPTAPHCRGPSSPVAIAAFSTLF